MVVAAAFFISKVDFLAVFHHGLPSTVGVVVILHVDRASSSSSSLEVLSEVNQKMAKVMEGSLNGLHCSNLSLAKSPKNLQM